MQTTALGTPMRPSIPFLAILLAADLTAGTTQPPSFRNDIMPILFRGGCNSGTCHGSSRGKDGFILSLFGFDPKGDYYRITQELPGRRINIAAPEKSLLLLKATGQVTHTGGEVFKQDSDYYRTLLDWVSAGVPDDAEKVPFPVEIQLEPNNFVFSSNGKPVQSKVTARYSDGQTRDVTHLARFFSNNPDSSKIDKYGLVTPTGRGDTSVFAQFNRFTVGSEAIVLPGGSDFKWSHPAAKNYIDEAVYGRLEKLHIQPSGICDDETFLRRAYLDLAGHQPTISEYRKFMADHSDGKRTKLIKELIASKDFAEVWAAIWAEALRVIGGNYTPLATDVKAADAYYRWIRQSFLENRPLSEFVSEQITATGSNLTYGPANLYTMLVNSPKFTPKAFAADFSQLFLGIQIQCAECHNHPFDRWTMNDYYQFVSFFTGIERRLGAEPREFFIYNEIQARPALHKVDNRPMPARVLGGEEDAPKDTDQREALAHWLTAKDNRIFARNMANRIWARFFARGLVEPVDDMRISNPPTNGPLLDALAERLASSHYDLRNLVGDICNSYTYQRAATPNETNVLDSRQFSRAQLRRLRADILLDSIIVATESERNFKDFPPGTRAIEFYPRNVYEGAVDPFLTTFGRSPRKSICSCETRMEPNLSQVLHLMVGDTVREAVRKGGIVEKLIKEGKSGVAIVEELFIRALTRKPTAEEVAGLLRLIPEKNPELGYQDIFCALLQSTEFAFNH